MRILPITVSLALIVCSISEVIFAEPILAGRTAPDIMNAISDWTTCRASKVVTLVGTSRSPDSIVDEAFQVCLPQEQAFRRVWLKHYGPNSAGQVQQMRARWREALIAQVNSVRTQKPVADPAGAWGMCVGSHIPDPVPADVASDVIADSAMAACSSEMDKLRADNTRKYGATVATNHLAQLRAEMRKKAIAAVEVYRARQ